ncbi:hypothetical protein QZH41_003098 [Actinostola sp. cb2023]|nr:hypothetical protein QZH41_003098 [Actinostola sp. cb2023]
MSASSPSGGRKVSAMSSCSSTSEVDEFTSEDYKAKIELLENEKLEWLEDKKDLGDEIKFLKYQLQYRIDVQSLQNDNTDKRESDKLVKENETLREENCNLKERLSTIKERLEEKGNVEENLLSIADVCNESAVSCESDIERLHTERKILLSTIMRMQSLEKDEDEPVTFADFGVQVDLNKLETIEENVATTPLVAKLTKENKALKKHITDMQKDLDEYEYDRKALNEENFKLIDEKRSLEDTSNKLRTQMSDTLDTTLDEIEQLHDFNEDLEGKFKRTEANFNQVLQTLNDLQSKNCKALESMLDEVESKVTMEEAFEYLDNEVSKLIQQNLSTTFQSAGPQVMQASKEEKQFSSNLLSEVKSCKEMLESQRSHIRKLQLDKRDIEEGYTNMKRELLLLKSSKQRARENSKELQFLRKRRAKSLNDGAAGATEAKAVLVDKESLQREVKRLGSVKVELENTIQKLKKEKTTLDDEKVCLLSSLYHQLERNESLEMQVEELSLALQQWEAKSDLDNDVFGEKTNEVKDSKPTAEEASDQSLKSPDAVATEIVPEGLEAGGDEAKEIQELSPNELDVEMSGRPTSPVVSVVSSAAQESMQEMKQKIHALGEQLQKVQESVYELETERDKILEDLEDSKKNEKELRNVIVQLKRENSIHKDKLAKSNELVETLQIRLRDAQDAKEEAIESLEEAKEEKTVSRKHCEVLINRLNEVTIQRDNFKKKTEHYNQYLQEIFNRTAEISNTSLTRDEHDTAKEQSSTGTQKDCELSQDDLETRLLDGLDAIQISIDDIKSKLSESCMKMSTLKRQLDVSNTEKDALQKSLRETDEKKKQLKGFITKLTEEKEKVNEQLDEMKQQKCNLADALENVYQSKEKLQNRLTETLCKQEQYKKSLVEAIDEAKTLKESLYRMVNEHETMKESLLIANREVERLKSQQILHNGTSAMNVIEEEDEQLSSEEENEQNKESDPNEKDVATIHVAETEMGPRIDRKNLCEVLDQLKESLNSLSRENALFESQVKQLLCASETKDVDTQDRRTH